VVSGGSGWLTELVWEASRKLEGCCRLLLVTGWAGLGDHGKSSSREWGGHVCSIPEAPHAWLFPR
jgi:hypothetical protein